MRKRIFVCGALGLSILCCSGAMRLGAALCTNRLEAEVASPDARNVARHYMASCYMDSIPELSVVITAQPERHSLWWHPDETTAVTFGTYGYRAGLSLRWLDADTLLIDYAQSELFNGCSGGMRNRLTEWRDLTIKYRGLCEDYD